MVHVKASVDFPSSEILLDIQVSLRMDLQTETSQPRIERLKRAIEFVEGLDILRWKALNGNGPMTIAVYEENAQVFQKNDDTLVER